MRPSTKKILDALTRLEEMFKTKLTISQGTCTTSAGSAETKTFFWNGVPTQVPEHPLLWWRGYWEGIKEGKEKGRRWLKEDIEALLIDIQEEAKNADGLVYIDYLEKRIREL
jgi:hypothetical protein